MFGLSLTKILFTVLVIVAVWRGLALIARLQDLRRDGAKPHPGRAPTRAGRGGGASPPAIDLVPCPSCGAYVARGKACPCRRRA